MNKFPFHWKVIRFSSILWNCKSSGICNSSSWEVEAEGPGQSHLCREASCTRQEHRILETWAQSTIQFFPSFPFRVGFFFFSAMASWFCSGGNRTQNLDMLGKTSVLHLQTLNSLLWGSLMIYMFSRTIIDSTVCRFFNFKCWILVKLFNFSRFPITHF